MQTQLAGVVYLVSEVACKVIVLPGEVLIIQLS